MLRLPLGPHSFHFRLGLSLCFRFGRPFLPRFWLHPFRKLRRSCLAIPFLKSLIGYFAFEQKLGEFPTLRLAFKWHDIPLVCVKGILQLTSKPYVFPKNELRFAIASASLL